MSSLLSDPRFRPALLALAGISATYAIYLLRQRYVGLRETSEPQSQLRRRNAIRRHDAPRRRRTQTPSPPQVVDSIEISEQAIAALHTREDEGRSYGFLDIHSIEQELGRDTGRRREARWPLLPALLPTAQQFQAQEGISAEDAQGLRNHAEVMFMDAFLVNEWPLGHTVGQLEATYFQEQLSRMGIGSSVVQQSIERFNADPYFGSGMRQAPHDQPTDPPSVDGASEFQRLDDLFQALDGRETTADGHSNFDWREGSGNVNGDREGQNTLNLLYNIAADQARKDGYIHRGVQCNGCGLIPIQGIRYRCANCLDFDLCESCEAQELHIKTHVFYKVRVPAPSLGVVGNSRQGLPVWYPGKPGAMRSTLPRELSSRLLQESGFDTSELDALWDQFRCLAGTEWNRDPNKLGTAIDRKTFDKCFVPPLSIRPPPPNIIYDRMFDFYDTNHDGLIGFEEFLKGLACLNDKSREGKLRRIFQGYDMDNDGYVDRKDFLRMFRAFYTLSKEVCREKVAVMEEEIIDGGARDIVHGSQPISSAFPGNIPLGHASRGGMGKEVDANGDLAITDNRGVFDDEFHHGRDRSQVIADGAVRSQRRLAEPLSFSQRAETNGPLSRPRQMENGAADIHPADHNNSSVENLALTDEGEPPFHNYSWPPFAEVRPADVALALGREVPLSEIMDPVDRARVLVAQSERIDADFERRRNDAIQDRWRRRGFYTDVEEGGTAPAGYMETDNSDDEAVLGKDAMDSVTSASISRPLSPRSRSSSKVRFEDSITDTDYETRSNTSSRSIPVGERWGGYDISEIEKDAGKEILYQAVQQGFNELLDQLFKEKEDLTMEAHKTRKMRRLCAKEIQAFAESLTAEPKRAEEEREKEDEYPATTTPDASTQQSKEAELDGLLQEAGYLCDATTDDEDVTPETDPASPPPSDHTIHTGQFDSFPLSHYVMPNGVSDPNHSSARSIDPTLPQFLPNEPGTNAPSPPLPPTLPSDPHPDASRLQNSLEVPSADNTSPSHPHRSVSPISAERKMTLNLYLKHEQIDEEARLRGGFGKLDYGEFVKGMLADEGSDVNGDEKGPGKRSRGKGGEMGKLGFVGSWIEMASF